MTETERARAKNRYRDYLIAHHNYLDCPNTQTCDAWTGAHEKWINEQRATGMTSGERREIRAEVVAELNAVG